MNDGDPTAHVAQRALARLRAVLPEGVAFDEARLSKLAVVSDFAVDTLEKQPELLARLLADDGVSPVPLPVLDAGNKSEWPRLLRRYRQAGSARLVWRDVLGLDEVEDTLAGSTALADTCLQLGLAAMEADFAGRHGEVIAADGSVQRLVVFGLGKLGGGELNFSSDIDLVYAYEHAGESDGARPLDASDYFARLGQQLAKLLDDMTVDGFCHRVDLRLRPFGSAGRVALSFAAMEQYYQREGRDWERYAWQKARPVAGDIAAGERFLETLRPFVYRRYLDFGALEGLRTMKASIAAEVARKEREDDIKLGAGGIREIEFLAQALQLIRGGREPELQERRLVPALRALVAARQVDAGDADDLVSAYYFLRRVENRLQMLGDAQIHQLPLDPSIRQRIAKGLSFDGWPALLAMLDGHRARVSREFDALLAPRDRKRVEGALDGYWRALPDGGASRALAEAGFTESDALDAKLRDFARSPGVQALSDTARARMQRVMPRLLDAAANASQPDAALRGVLGLLRNVLRRTSYLALLDEEPDAMTRLVGLVARSAMLAERVAMYPLLLDELLDARIAGPLPGREGLREACEAAVAASDGDVESALQALNETRQALGFRIGLATLDERQTAGDSARQLAWLADAVVAIAVRLAEADMAQAHGRVQGARFAVLGYGSLGGEELGIGSDLDLVFLYRLPEGSAADVQSDGPRPLDAQRWHARLAQKIVALLGSETGAGKLYEVDVRLRPDGASGLLVSSFDSYAGYQRERAWTWEHQALVRARCVAGDAGLCADFDRVRGEVLGRRRDEAKLRGDVVEMRAKMRAELDRSSGGLFDLKQGEGGLVDLEFLLQYLVLRHAAEHPQVVSPRATPLLIDALRGTGLLSADDACRLREVHAALAGAGLQCTLDRRRRLIEASDAIEAARASVRSVARAHGLDFSATA